MTTHRFFVTADAVRGERFALPDAIRHQVRTVLRLRDGDRLVLLPGDGTELGCRLDGNQCVVTERRPAAGEPAHRLTVIQALLKGDALEEVVARGTEIGVAAFRLAVSDRCVAQSLSSRKLDRLRAIARESAEVSERGIVPEVHAPEPLDRIVGQGAVVLYERADEGPRLVVVPPPATVVIGPEGGFVPREVERAVAAGATLASLGPRVLRARTVAPVAAAIVLSRTGDFA